MKTLSTALAFCLISFWLIPVTAVTSGHGVYEAQNFDLTETSKGHNFLPEEQLLAENEQDSEFTSESGPIVFPGASESQAKEKKCVTVCDEWGRDCIINPKTGQRKCRRMCKSFGQECL